MIDLTVESWIWYGFVVAVAIARFISRSLALGSFRHLQIDDYIMAFAIFTYTALIISINYVADDDTNLLPPGFDMKSLTKQDKEDRRLGSKLVLVVEQNQILTIWAVKACLLIMYYRLTIVQKENIAVVALAIYVAFGFVFMEIFYFAVWCRPFHNYWAVPTPNTQCSAAIHHLITNAVFNLSSDVLTLALALQMFIRSKLPLQRKLILCGIFGLGVFVILAALLNKYYSFREPFGSLWTFWYVRESSTAVLVANLPFLWTLLRRIFNLHAFGPEHSRTGSYAGSTTRAASDMTAPQYSESRSWFRQLRNQGRRLSSHVLHGVDPAGRSGRSHSNGIGTDLSKTSQRRGSRFRNPNSVMQSFESREPILNPTSPNPQRQTHDIEAQTEQRMPWDEMDLGEFLTESNGPEDVRNATRPGYEARRTTGRKG
ncbi:MAG: hypothetical protein M1820_007996 [Bogoriella megaspora]|nr:MAG: hypothetical protein M1820_007996 [Bogoriella megaspora]